VVEIQPVFWNRIYIVHIKTRISVLKCYRLSNRFCGNARSWKLLTLYHVKTFLIIKSITLPIKCVR